jgi:hypothetical protein
MKNTEIINNLKIDLASIGAIRGFVKKDKIVPAEEIYTRGAWKKQGYKINKDEEPVAKAYITITIGKKIIKENGVTYEKPIMIPVLAGFFKESQTTKIEVATNVATSITLKPAA